MVRLIAIKIFDVMQHLQTFLNLALVVIIFISRLYLLVSASLIPTSVDH